MVAHLARVKAVYAALSREARFVQIANRDARCQYGIPDQQITEADLLPLADGCVYCGGPAVEWDHIEPQAAGGRNEGANLVPTCRLCNASKNGRTPEQWLAAGLYGLEIVRLRARRSRVAA